MKNNWYLRIIARRWYIRTFFHEPIARKKDESGWNGQLRSAVTYLDGLSKNQFNSENPFISMRKALAYNRDVRRLVRCGFPVEEAARKLMIRVINVEDAIKLVGDTGVV